MSRARKAVAYVALFHVGMGLSLFFGPHAPGIPDHALLYDLLPWPSRAALWVTLGIVAALVSMRSVRWGWVLLSIMPAQRLVGHAYSAYAWLVPGIPQGLPSAFADVIIWASVLLLIRHLAGWPDLSAVRTGESRQA